MFPIINPSCWWSNTAFLAPTACISPGFTIRIAAWHSSLVTSPYQYLRRAGRGSWATLFERHQSWKILHVFATILYHFMLCFMKWNIISMDIHGNFCPWPNRTISSIFSKRRKLNFFPQESPILQPGIDMLEHSRTMIWLRKVDPPVQNNKSMMGLTRFSVRENFDVFSCFLHLLLVFSLKYPLRSLYSQWTDSLHLDQIAIR